MATLTFLKFLRVIQVDDPVEGTSVTIQELINAIRDYEDELSFMDYGHIANASGKQDLGGGSRVGITLELINDWRIQFETPGVPPTITVYVRGGNLVATNSYSNNPIKPSDYVTVVIAQSSSPTIITPAADLNMLYLVESLRGTHQSLGNIYYWNPTGGSDANDGLQPSSARLTFAATKALTSAGNNDIIFALSTAAGGVTTVTENLTLDVPNLKVRGAGYPFQLKPTSGDAITISADNVEISGFYIEPVAGKGIKVYTGTGSVDNTLITDCWIKSATGNGIDVSNAARTRIEKCAVEDSTGNGIQLGAATTRSVISTSIVSGNVNGVDLTGSGLVDNILENNLIYNHTGYGLNIAAGPLRTHVRSGHTFSKNTLGDTNYPSGYDTFVETQAGGLNATQVANAVWNEVISTTAHAGASTAGKILRDAKTKATLASLK